jgi:outer membrane protein TolC
MSSQDRSIAPRDKVAAIDDVAVRAKRLVVPVNLAAMRLLTQEIQQEQETVVSAQRFFDVASVRYKTGLGPYLNVFTAQAGLLANQLTVITLRVQQMTSSVQLIESLGGG